MEMQNMIAAATEAQGAPGGGKFEQSRKACKFFPFGTCQKGESCPWVHEPQEVKAETFNKVLGHPMPKHTAQNHQPVHDRVER